MLKISIGQTEIEVMGLRFEEFKENHQRGSKIHFLYIWILKYGTDLQKLTVVLEERVSIAN